MRAKEFLNRAYKLDLEIEEMKQEKALLLNRITSPVSSLGSEVVSGTKDPHKYDTYANYCLEIDKRNEELMAIKREIKETIYKVNDTKLRTLLLARYINFKTFEQIAVDMSYDWRHIMRLHKEALQTVEQILS